MAPGRSLARVYPNVNEKMGRGFWDYDNLMVSWGVREDSLEASADGLCSSRTTTRFAAR